MSGNQLATTGQNAIRTIGDDFFTKEQWSLLTDTIMKGATPQEVSFFGEVCKRTNLDPFRRQIYAVSRWDQKAGRHVWSFQTGVDGYRAIANRTGTYAGNDDPQFIPADESAPHPTKATVTVWRLVNGHRVAFTASARWSEYVQTAKDKQTGQEYATGMWKKMPYAQLAKCAEALALRKAFPEETSGVYTDVEMEQADNEPDYSQPPATRRSFDMETKTFQQKQTEPLPQEPPPAEKEISIDAEVLPPFNPPIPEAIAAHIGGKWKTVLGDIKGKHLTDARKEGSDAALASVIDEIRARLAAKSIREDEFAAQVSMQVQGLGFPEELWMTPALYSDLLKLCRDITA